MMKTFGWFYLLCQKFRKKCGSNLYRQYYENFNASGFALMVINFTGQTELINHIQIDKTLCNTLWGTNKLCRVVPTTYNAIIIGQIRQVCDESKY